MTLDETRTDATIDTWCTPEHVLVLVRQALGGRILLDPCTTADNPTNAQHIYTAAGDTHPWIDGWFCNPPYGGALKAWSKQIAYQGVLRGKEGIALVPGRPDTAWYDALSTSCAAEIFWRGRIRFVRPPGDTRPADSPKFPNVLFYYGPHTDRVFKVFADHARVWVK